MVDDLLAAHGVREHRAGVVRHIVDQHGAGAAFGAVAAELGAGEAQLVAQRHRQRFLLHDVDAPLLAVDVQRDQALDRPGGGLLRAHHGTAEQIAAEDTAPAAMTPLMTSRLESPFGVSSMWFLSAISDHLAGNTN